MADVAPDLNSWSATESSNSPTDSTTIGAGLANNLGAIQAVVRGYLAAKGSDIASSAAPDVAAVQGLYHDLTGAVTVTGLGSTATAGIWRILQTDSTPVFKHSTALAMPGAADFTASAGDVLAFMCEASNQWRCMFGSPYAPPAGAIMDYGGSTAPSGWLECNGTAVSRTTYARLFAAVSTTWGAGDESTTFNLPNFRGRGRVGRGTGLSVDDGENADVDTTNDTLTVPTNTHKWVTGMAVVFNLTSGTITGLSDDTTYYVIRASTTTIKLATTLANAQNGTAIDLTAKSSPVWDITHTYTARTLGEYGGEQNHAQSSTESLLHTHTQDSHAHTVPTVSAGGGTNNVLVESDQNTSGTTPTSGTVAVNQNFGGNAAANIMQPFGIVMTIIKT